MGDPEHIEILAGLAVSLGADEVLLALDRQTDLSLIKTLEMSGWKRSLKVMLTLAR